jgi:gamma-glutamylcyclotransferase (GGCT)/AIG2-like uncharacterized protein YtfP
MSRPIFVYGTLRPGYGNDWLWRGRAHAAFDGQARVLGHALVTQGWFPYMVPATAAETVGALIVPDPDQYDYVLHRMDRLEGVPVHYRRILISVAVPHGIVTAWTYVPADEADHLWADVARNDDGSYDWAAQPLRRSTRA